MIPHFILKSKVCNHEMVEGFFLKSEILDLFDAIETIAIFKLVLLPNNPDAKVEDVVFGNYDYQLVADNLLPLEIEGQIGFHNGKGDMIYVEERIEKNLVDCQFIYEGEY